MNIPFDLDLLRSMRRNPVSNYIVPGLTSWIIGAKHGGGCVRMFHSSRRQQEAITPHSHRFDFQCAVLKGKVTNRIWYPDMTGGDTFLSTQLHFNDLGEYTRGSTLEKCYSYSDQHFSEGNTYRMRATEIHSIYFDQDTEVLFFEGPSKSYESTILEPIVDGEPVHTFEVKPWMFKKGEEE